MENRMDFGDGSYEMGHEFGSAGVDGLVNQAAQACSHHRRTIDLTNEAVITGLRMELAMWADEDKTIGERLRLAPPPGDRWSRRVKLLFAGAVAAVLALAGFFFSVLALDPFRLGWKSYLYAAGIAVVAPYCVEEALEAWDCQVLIKIVATTATVCALASLMSFADIRGKILAHVEDSSEVTVVSVDDAPTTSQSSDSFYKDSRPLLELAMKLLALAMELGVGLALFDVKRHGGASVSDAKALGQERILVRKRVTAIAMQIGELSNAGQIYEERFWRDFYRAMLTSGVKNALGRLLVLGLCLLGIGADLTRADDQRLDVVIAIDLSASVAARGPDGKTDFEKNSAAVTNALAHLPAGSRVTVLGITEDSFSQPDIILAATLPQDAGYFGERLAAGRQELVRAWKKRQPLIGPTAKQTDILGALLVAEQLFQNEPFAQRKVLIIFSDMRQATSVVNFDRFSSIAVDSALQTVRKHDLVSQLTGVDVDVLGADAAGRDAAAWARLRGFWTAYFHESGASVRAYSVLRNQVDF